MRFEETPTRVLVEQAPGAVVRAVGLVFPVLAVLLAGIGILGVVRPPAGGTDLFTVFGLALASTAMTLAFAPRLRTTCVEVTAAPRRLRLTTCGLLGRVRTRELDVGEIAKVSAWCSDDEGWARLSLGLHTGDEIQLFRLARSGRARRGAARSLELLSRMLGVGVELSEPYRRHWMR